MNAQALRKPVCDTDPARRGGIDLNANAHEEIWLATAPLSKLVLEHDDLQRRLNIPHQELWAESYARDQARLKAIWQTIRRRFPEYAAKHGRQM